MTNAGTHDVQWHERYSISVALSTTHNSVLFKKREREGLIVSHVQIGIKNWHDISYQHVFITVHLQHGCTEKTKQASDQYKTLQR